MGVPQARWMVYLCLFHGKSGFKMDDDWGYTILWLVYFMENPD